MARGHQQLNHPGAQQEGFRSDGAGLCGLGRDVAGRTVWSRWSLRLAPRLRRQPLQGQEGPGEEGWGPDRHVHGVPQQRGGWRIHGVSEAQCVCEACGKSSRAVV